MEYIGFLAATLTTISFIPQVLKIMKTKDTSGLSLGMYICFVIGVILWTIYGYINNDVPVFVANFITLMLAVIILYNIIKNKIK